MSMSPRQPPPEPPPSVLRRVLKVLAIVAGAFVLVLLIGVGLIWATCSGMGRR